MRGATDLSAEGVIAAFWAAILFLVMFGLNSHWWRYTLTWVIASIDLVFWTTIAPSAIRYMFFLHLSHTFLTYWYGGAMNLAAVVLVWRGWTMRRIQLAGDGEEHPGAGS